MTEREKMKHFYLTDHDFNVYCNKNMQTYNRSLEDEMNNPITLEYYRSMQRGGCNAKRTDRKENS